MNRPIFFTLIIILSQTCSLTFNSSTIRSPRQFELLLYPSKNSNKTLCFYLDKPKTNQTYLLRLDYLPYQCLQADNDQPLHWDGQAYFAEVTVTRKCKKLSLRQSEQTSYRFIYEFRQGFNQAGIIVSKELVYQYLPTIAVLFILSIIIERIIGRQFISSQKIKND